MSDARWADPRKYDARDRSDEWPRVYDPRDRDEHDPREPEIVIIIEEEQQDRDIAQRARCKQQRP